MIYIFMPKKKNARLILCFHVGTGKNVYIVLSGSPRQSSMALAGGLRGNRKGLYRLHLACLWWSSRLYSCWASSLYLWTRVSREHRRSCTHTDTVHFNRHWRHFRHGLQYLQKTLTWSHALDNRGVSDPWGGVSAGVQSCPRWERNRQIIQCCENVCTSP